MARNESFRDVVRIDRDTSAGGSAVPDYSGSPYMTSVPCRIVTIAGNETYRGRMLEAHLTHIVLMHWYDGITPTMRLTVTAGLLNGRTLNIEHVKPVDFDGRAAKAELHCVENVGR